jgi:hypothetical protein
VTTILQAALDYAARGWAVFPLQPQSKLPATRRGFYDATANPETLRRWFGRGFAYNLAVRTGVPSGVFVLDIDGAEGVTNFLALIAEHGRLPETLISATGKGHHLYFQTVVEIPCSTGKIASGLDIRADGGYVAVAPSIHPNGTVYRWANDLPVAPAPDWLIRLAQQRPAPVPLPALPALPALPPTPTRIITGVSSAAYGEAALDREIETLSLTSSGNRNSALNLASFRLHQLVAGQELYGDAVAHGLLHAAQRNGLLAENGLRQVQATIQSGATAGLRYPRDRHGRR